MSEETFDKGDDVRVEAEFTNTAGTHIDPTTVKVKIKDPSGNVVEYVYGTDAAVVKDAVGIYHIDVDAAEDGLWRWRWYSTGTGKAAEEGSFRVEASSF